MKKTLLAFMVAFSFLLTSCIFSDGDVDDKKDDQKVEQPADDKKDDSKEDGTSKEESKEETKDTQDNQNPESDGTQSSDSDSDSQNSGSSGYPLLEDDLVESNPSLGLDRSATLDRLFSLDSVGTTVIKIKRSEWNQLCQNFDDFHENEEYVHCDYVYQKDGKEWILKDVGFRMRGNTTRVRPQGPDKYKKIPRNNWEDGTLAQSDGYRQSHFKVNFEKFTSKDVDHKMSDYAKGVNLKRFNGDKAYGREIFCYDLFRHYGIFSAPRASYSRMFVYIDEENGDLTKLDYGVYEMFEDMGKQYVKSHEDKWGEFKAKKASLFKCSWGAFFTKDSLNGHVGEDEVLLERGGDGSVSRIVNNTYRYSFKEGDLENAKKQLENFVNGLNSNPSKEWIEANMDVELFTRTLAVSVLTGMDDDYWGNSNNFYIYFDAENKLYLIPYDYDNTLGHEIHMPKAYERNIFQWCEDGEIGNRPLVEKVLAIPEFKELYARQIKEIANDDYFLRKSQSRIQLWQARIGNYVKSSDIVYDNDVSDVIENSDWSGDIFSHFEKMRRNVENWETDRKINFDLNGGNINGDTSVVIKEGKISGFAGLIDKPKFGTKYFRGWTLTKDGEDYVSSCPSGTMEMTVYAKWADSLTKVMQLTNEGYLFSFDPRDWNCDPNDNVWIVGIDNNWTCSNGNKMTKQSDGTFTWLFPFEKCLYTGISDSYKFFVGSNWLDVDKYKFLDVSGENKVVGDSYDNFTPGTSDNGLYVRNFYEGENLTGSDPYKNCYVNTRVPGKSKLWIRVYEMGDPDSNDPRMDGKKIRMNGRIVERRDVFMWYAQQLELSDLPVPVCEGRKFVGWYWNVYNTKEGVVFDENEKVTDIPLFGFDTQINARWE